MMIMIQNLIKAQFITGVLQSFVEYIFNQQGFPIKFNYAKLILINELKSIHQIIAVAVYKISRNSTILMLQSRIFNEPYSKYRSQRKYNENENMCYICVCILRINCTTTSNNDSNNHLRIIVRITFSRQLFKNHWCCLSINWQNMKMNTHITF